MRQYVRKFENSTFKEMFNSGGGNHGQNHINFLRIKILHSIQNTDAFYLENHIAGRHS